MDSEPEAAPRARTKPRQLRAMLKKSGRLEKCEVFGCCALAPALEIHHVMPLAVAALAHGANPEFVDGPENLVYLCQDHHALVERFYWWERGALAPDLCQAITGVVNAFEARVFTTQQAEIAHHQLCGLRKQLDGVSPVNALWWRSVYQRALRWSQHQQVLREVPPNKAISATPWFRDRRGLAVPVFQESEASAS